MSRTAQTPAPVTTADPAVDWATALLEPADRLEFERRRLPLRLTLLIGPLMLVSAYGAPVAVLAALLAGLIGGSYLLIRLLLDRRPALLLRWQLGLRLLDVGLIFAALSSVYPVLTETNLDGTYVLPVLVASATHGRRGALIVAGAALGAMLFERAQLISAGLLPPDPRQLLPPIFFASIFAAVGSTVSFLMRTSAEVVERRDAAWRAELAARNDELARAALQLTSANRELEQRATQLQTLNRELEAFAYSVSHDLRAPLRAIDGFGRVLVTSYSENLDDRGRDYLGRIRAASQRMGHLIDDLLKLSRLTRAEMHREQVDLSVLVCAVVDDLRQAHPERDVTVEIQPGLTTDGDPRLLRIAIENLIGNAWKFTANRAGASVSFSAVERDGQRVYCVRDNGAGFDMAYADKLFGAFQRLHSANEFEGTGIGLATVQRVVHRHGGRVWAEGAVDQGAAFYFTL